MPLLLISRLGVSGEPFFHRYELTKTAELLNRLKAAIPNLLVYDPDKDERFPWEENVAEFIEKLKAEKNKNAE